MKLEALGAPVTKDEVKAFMERHPVKRTFFNPSRDIMSGLILLLVVGIFVTPLLSTNIIVAVAFVVAVLGALAVIVAFYFHYHNAFAMKQAEKALRVERLAQSNGWQYVHRTQFEQPKTAVFSYGHEHEFVNVVSTPGFQIGEMQYMTGTGRSEQTHACGYMVITLNRSLPHMILDGKSNNLKLFGTEVSNISTMFDKNQIDILEGDFNQYYNLYAPEGYGIDVRYLFTPDLMQTLIEESDSIDIEVMDNNVFVYFGKHELDTKEFWQKAERLKSAFTDKISTKATRYEDSNTVDGQLAPEAKRLKKRIPLFIIFIAIFVIIVNGMDLVKNIGKMLNAW